MLSYEIKKGRSRARQAVRRPPYCPSGWPAGQQLIAILHYLVDIKYLFRGENEHNAMGEEGEGSLLKFLAFVGGSEYCCELPWHLAVRLFLSV